jgi:hypothetical protein
MLAVTSYPQAYIDACRARTEAQIARHTAMTASAGKGKAAAVEALDHDFYDNLTLLLDYSFVHRTRAKEGKDGNPLNEVRMLCNSILGNDGVLAADKAIKYKPEASVSKLKIGDPIRLDEAQFMPLCKAFFTELERRFT